MMTCLKWHSRHTHMRHKGRRHDAPIWRGISTLMKDVSKFTVAFYCLVCPRRKKVSNSRIRTTLDNISALSRVDWLFGVLLPKVMILAVLN